MYVYHQDCSLTFGDGDSIDIIVHSDKMLQSVCQYVAAATPMRHQSGDIHKNYKVPYKVPYRNVSSDLH